MGQFSSELIAILGVGVAVLSVGVAVASLVLRQGRRLDSRIDALAVHMTKQYRQLTEQHGQLTEQMNERFQHLSERVARVEGKLDLLEPLITQRNETPTVAAE